jgi:hypothetical protein
MPEGMEHVWNAFQRLSSTRNSGMSLGPVTYLEVQAYRSETLDDLTAWEVTVIMRVDLAVRAVLADQAPKKQGEANTQVDVNDRKGMRGLLSDIGERWRARQKGGAS